MFASFRLVSFPVSFYPLGPLWLLHIPLSRVRAPNQPRPLEKRKKQWKVKGYPQPSSGGHRETSETASHVMASIAELPNQAYRNFGFYTPFSCVQNHHVICQAVLQLVPLRA